VILDTQEAESRITNRFKASPRKIVLKTLFYKNKSEKGASSMAEAVRGCA
jgi:hypothetical protein